MLNKRQRGFTIVELLIVIVVIAILATVSVVAYTGIQNRANDMVIEADISEVIKYLEIAKVDLGRYPQADYEFPEGFKFSKASYDPTQNNIYYCLDIVNQRYAFGLRSKSLKGYILNTGTVTKGVTANGSSTCQAIDKEWSETDPTTMVFQGYIGSSKHWNAGSNWTR